jgi:hypothetical protein
MTRLLLLPVVLLLAACSTLKSVEAPGCSGPRRPANPHGSVLQPDASAAAASPATAGGQCLGGQR